MSDGEPEIPSEASATLARLGLSDLRPVYQPVVDLRDGRVVGYEALIRGDPGSPLSSPAELFAAARAADVVAEFDAACRAAAVRGFELDGAGPFALFLNAAADTLGDAAEVVAPARHTIVIEITEQALVSRPDVLLRALTQFRTQGWGVALQNVGADSRSLALMSLLYPDVIKLDLRRLQQRSPEDVARIVGAVGAESERRQAIVLVEGIDSEEQLAAARAFGAQLGQGFLLGEPGPLPATMPEPGRALRLTSSGGDPGGDSPFLRVTNWKRPARGSRELAEATAGLILRQAAALGETAVVLAAYPHEDHLSPSERPPNCVRWPASSPSSARSARPPRWPRTASAPARCRRTTRCAGPGPSWRSGRASPPASSPARRKTGPTSSPPPTTATWSWSRRC